MSSPQTPRASSWDHSCSLRACWSQSAVVDRARPVADPAVIVGADAVIDIVTQTVTVRICRAVPIADAEGVELVAVAVAVPGGDVHRIRSRRWRRVRCRCRSRRRLPTQSSTSSQMTVTVDRPCSHHRRRRGRRAGCHRSRSRRRGCHRTRNRRWCQDHCRCRSRQLPTQSSTSSQTPSSHCPHLPSSLHRRRRGRRVGCRRSRSHLLECHRTHNRRWRRAHCRCRSHRSCRRSHRHRVTDHRRPHRPRSHHRRRRGRRVGCRRSRSRQRDVFAPAIEDGAGSVADAAVVELPDAVVDVVADAVRIRIGGAVTTADAEGVELVAVAVTVSCSNAFSTANAAFIELGARAVVFAGVRIKIAGAGIGAPENGRSRFK